MGSTHRLTFKKKSYLTRFLQVSRIARHRQVPKHVKSSQAELRTIKESKGKKEANRRKHSKPGAMPHVPEREQHTVQEQE